MNLTDFKVNKGLFTSASGLYVITHRLYPGFVKIGLGKPLSSRILGYQTHIPKDDYKVHAIAIKPNNRILIAQGKQHTYSYYAEQRLLKEFRTNRKTEWVLANIKDVIAKMRLFHFGDTTNKSDGYNLPFYTFDEKQMYLTSPQPQTRTKQKNMTDSIPQRKTTRIPKPSKKVLANKK